MAINVSVQYNGGLLPDIILLTQCYYHRGTRSNAMKRFCIICMFVHPGHRQVRETLGRITKNVLLMYRRIKERHEGLNENRRVLRKIPEDDGYRRRRKLSSED